MSNIFLNGVNITHQISSESLYDRLEELKAYEGIIDYDIDRHFRLSDEQDLQYAMEGLIFDTLRTAKSGIGAASRAGKTAYKAGKRQYNRLKDRWNQIKPVIIKVIKDLGITLSNLYGKFMKYDKDYAELGKRIDSVIRYKVPLIQNNKSTIILEMFDFDPQTLSNFCKMIESYDGFVNICMNDEGLAGGSFVRPDDFIKLVQKNVNPRNGEVNSDAIRKVLDPMIQAIGNLTKNGDLTIPRALWANKKFTAPVNIPFMKKHNETREFNKNMKDTLTAANFTKQAILGQMTTVEFEPTQNAELQKFLVNGNNGGYLNIMKYFLNNKVVETTLKNSGKSIKKETDGYFKSLQNMMRELDATITKVNEVKAKNNTDGKNDITDPNYDPAAAMDKKDKEMRNKTFANSNDGAMNYEDVGNDLESIIEGYVTVCNTFFVKTASSYSSMVNGLLSASYELIGNCKTIVDRIDALSPEEVKRNNEFK
ncbi:MAG: hypothetical protein ACRC92_20470 [Peptostreptococcaceae bacterium]